jgi:hypothetical protein
VTIAEALAAEAAGLEGVARHAVGDAIEWATGGVTFAVSGGDVAEFRLDPVIAAAARGTPDAGGSSRGGDWVAFRPPQLDQYSRDRAVAWFGSAYRSASRARGQESKRPR